MTLMEFEAEGGTDAIADHDDEIVLDPTAVVVDDEVEDDDDDD